MAIQQVTWQGRHYHVGISRWQEKGRLQWPILVAIPMDDLLDELARNRQTTLLITVLAWLLLLGIGMGLNSWLVNRPIARLASAVQRASQGELAHVDIAHVKELAGLADSFNAMIKNLHTLHHQLLLTNQTLEQQVVARTQELTRLKEQAEHLARTDPLTGLANRRALAEMSVRLLALAERAQRPLSVMALDIDHFKHVNDTYGHPAGDRVLQTLAKVLQANLRASDLVARVGGEEFNVLLPDTGAQEAAAFAQRLRLAVMAMEVDAGAGFVVHITASFGITQTHAGNTTLDALLTAADAALYQSKQTGRNRVTLDSGCTS